MRKTSKIFIIFGLFCVMVGGIVFGILYGSKSQSFAEQTIIDTKSAEEILKSAKEWKSNLEEKILEETTQTQINLSQDNTSVLGEGAEVLGNKITIDRGGIYQISGALENGQLYIKAGSQDIVVLKLNGAEITNEIEAAIYIENAKNTILWLADDTTNKIQSGMVTEIVAVKENNNQEDNSQENNNQNNNQEDNSQENNNQNNNQKDNSQEDTTQEAAGGAIYSRDDLSIIGSGLLEVSGYLNNGIHTTNDLVIIDGNIEVKSVNNGIKGKDSVTVLGGDITITSGNDAIKSDDTTGEGYGIVIIEEGNISIDSQGDAVQAETVLDITGGTITIVSGGGSPELGENQEGSEFAFPGQKEGKMPNDFRENKHENFDFTKDENGEIREFPENGDNEGFTIPEKPSAGERPNGGRREGEDFDFPRDENGEIREFPENRENFDENNRDMEEENVSSKKGLKCGTQMLISGGTFVVDSYDDAFHSNGSILISGGNITVSSGDDGIHADEELTITGGNIQITKSYEGLESNQVIIQGGEIDIVSSDDGINANGEQDIPNLRIIDGNISINAQGDGLDSNGNLSIEGGVVVVDGPTFNGNGAIDSGFENGGSCIISGGTVLAIGSSGMAETFEENSSQCSFLYSLDSSFEAGSEIVILDQEGNILFQHTAEKEASSIVFSCPQISVGNTYQLKVNDNIIEITQDSISSTFGQKNQGFGNGRW